MVGVEWAARSDETRGHECNTRWFVMQQPTQQLQKVAAAATAEATEGSADLAAAATAANGQVLSAAALTELIQVTKRQQLDGSKLIDSLGLGGV